MITPLFRQTDVINYLTDQATEYIDETALRIFTYCGEAGIEYARNNGDYINRTGNLRNSIGYIVAKDGDIKADTFGPASYGSRTNKGIVVGKQLALKVLADHSTGWVLIMVAGMEYASLVESYGKDVLSGSSVFLTEFLETMINQLQ